jgi:hypothetical protein
MMRLPTATSPIIKRRIVILLIRNFSCETNAPRGDTDHVRIPQDHATRERTRRQENPSGVELKRKGITRVRPLEGGLAAWMALNFPVRPVQLPVVPADGSSGSVQSTAA